MRIKFITLFTVFFVFNCSSTFLSCSSNHTLKKFESDGCSLFPDRSLINEQDWCECCLEHDMAYWRGGDMDDRDTADKLFKNCIVKKTQNLPLAELMYNGVRLGGSPYFPTWYRWGYGWDLGRQYKGLTPEEKKLADKMLQEYIETNKGSICDNKP